MIRIRLAVIVAIGLLCAGPVQARRGVLPSNQRVSAAGKQVNLGLFPAGMAISRDGAFLLVTNNGFLGQSLMSVNTTTLRTKFQTIETGFNSLFQGIVLAPDGRTGFASAGGWENNTGETVVRIATIADDGKVTAAGCDSGGCISVNGFPAGLAISPDGQKLFVVQNLAHALAVVDVASRTMLTSIVVGKSPWSVAVHPTRHEVYVTNRGDRTVSIVDTDLNRVVATVPTGSNPNALAVTPDGSKVFVANANTDDLTVFDVANPTAARTISLTPFAGARPGASPSALTISPDGAAVYVALSWENAVAVINAATEALQGYIPTGFYPSALAVSPDGQTLYIANMKGARTYPRTPKLQKADYRFNIDLGGTYGVRGTLSVLPVPSVAKLAGYTGRVRFNNGYGAGLRPSNHRPAPTPCFPIPCAAEDITPIRHVFFIVRENKTYDQVLGDLPQGDGDPSLVLYARDRQGREISPNTRALAQEFVLMDRLFANSEKSEPGHNWVMGAIDTDYGERTWVPVSFEVRPDDIGSHLSNEDGDVVRGTVYPIATPEGGFWFDNCHEHNVSFRNYGEFLRTDEAGVPLDYWAQNTNDDFSVFDLRVSDVSRYEVWRADFEQQVAAGTVPQFTYIALPNDHTDGRTSGSPVPEWYVADNDYALGKIVETISNTTEIWEHAVIFVIEDDPQSGGDHVDSHRTVGLVIGPYVRRRAVIHTRYDMASMHRTMELILGLPPMSIFDQMAIVMRDVFTETPDFTPYSALPQQIPLAYNGEGTSGAALSRRYNFSRPDRVPDAVLNQILWDYFHERERRR
ncbi:MAG: bifunctional YncE family protein/alkaline phosphatase family protein [Deltaproteobacteria bacterium]|nr:bifunctional YncE family protein/alkaline phosphatase family protein [Deltaproteobacteria bacterium]